MPRFLRLFLTLVPAGAVLMLAACGLRPVYGTGSGDPRLREDLSNIEVALIPEKEGLDLRNELMDQLYAHGRPADPKYRLVIPSVEMESYGLGISKDASASRAQLRARIDMTLVDAASGEKLLERRLYAVSSYNVLDSHFTTLVSKTEAEKNTINELANQVGIQLELYFTGDSH